MAGLFNAEVTEKIRKGLCLFLEEGDELFEWIGKTIFGKEVGDAITEAEEDQLGLLQRLLGRGVCDKGLDWEPVLPTSPFNGGQCSGIAYNVVVRVDYDDGNLNFPALQGTYTGAITSIVISNAPNPQNPATIGVLIEIRYNDGASYDYSFYRAVTGVPKSITVTRADGLPDNCGNPRPVIKNENPPEIVTDIEYDDENGVPQVLNNTVFVLGDVNISPNGNVSIGFNNSDLQLQGDINIFPNYGITYRNPIVPEIVKPERFNPQGEGTESPEQALDESNDVEEIPEDSLPIVGVVVKSQKLNFQSYPYTNVPNGSAPTIVIPRIAWVSFKIRKGETTAWMQPIDVKLVDAYIPCDNPDGAIAYSVQWGNGWKGKSFAILGKPLSDIKCCDEVS